MGHSAIMTENSLPGLSIALNRDAFMEFLETNLPECRAGVRLSDARVVDVQFTPGSSAQVLWKLHVQDPETGRTGRQLVFAKAVRADSPVPAQPEALIRRYNQIRQRKHMRRDMPLRTAWLFVSSASLLVHAFPVDPALPSLMDIADAEAVKDALNRTWRPRRARVRRVRIDMLSYTPEQRAALRYEVLSEDRDTGLPELRHMVGKLHARRSPARLFGGHWAVWRQTRGRVSIAPPAGYVATLGLSLQEFVSGTRLSDLAGPGAFVGQLRAAARSIAVVHSQVLPLLTQRGLDKELAVINRWLSVLTNLRPAQAARIERIGDRIRNELAERMRLGGTVHADFHLANILADDHAVTLIDWDQVAHGDPMIDVGRTLASLRVSSLRVHGTLTGFEAEQEAFLRAYLEQTNGDERRARLFEAVALLVAAAAPFRLQRPGWEESAESMVDETERVLRLSLDGPRITVPAPDGKLRIPFSERPKWALDRVYAQSLLVPALRDAYGQDIEVIETLPELIESSSERLHVRWNLRGFNGTEPWAADLDGLGFPDDSGKGRLRRLMLAGDALAADRAALQLPRALSHLGPLSLQVFESPAGRPLTEFLTGADEPGAVRQVALALARFHSLDIELGKYRETFRDLRSVERRLVRMEAACHAAAGQARRLIAQLSSALGRLEERRAPVVRGIRLGEIRLSGEQTGVAVIQDIVLSDPLLGAGDLAAQFRSYALKRGLSSSAADIFRDAYLDASGERERSLRVFEALALLWRACRRGAANAGDPLAHLLIDAAAERLGAG